MPTLLWIDYYFYLLPIAVFLFFLISKRKIVTPLWVILFYCLYSFANNSKIIYDSLNGQNSHLFLYIFTIVEYSLFATFIYLVLEKAVFKRALLFCSFLFTAFCLFNIFFQPKYRFDSVPTAIESLILLVFCILFLFEQINKPEQVFIYSSYKFWIITGILVYLAATFFLYVFAASLPLEQLRQWWDINHFGNILKNIFFSIATIIHAKASKPPPHNPIERSYQPFLN